MQDSSTLTRSLGENTARNVIMARGPDANQVGPFYRDAGEATSAAGCANPGCSAAGSLKCGACRSVLYCSKECQAAHWKLKSGGLLEFGHKDVCSDKNFQAAAHLLLECIENLDIARVSALLEAGLSLRFHCTRTGVNPLLLAACPTTQLSKADSKRLVEIVRLLLKYGSPVNKCCNPGNGNTALHLACEYGCVELVAALLEAADVDVNIKKASSSASPLHLCSGLSKTSASWPDLVEIGKMLLARGADPNAMAHGGRSSGSVLEYVAMGGNLELVRVLLDAGAVDTDDMALGIANNLGLTDVAALLRSRSL